MAVLKMKKISIYGLHADRKAVLEDLQKRGVVEVTEPGTAELNNKDTDKSISQFEDFIRSAETALAVLDGYVPEKSGLFTGRRILPMQKYFFLSLMISDPITTRRNSILLIL